MRKKSLSMGARVESDRRLRKRAQSECISESPNNSRAFLWCRLNTFRRTAYHGDDQRNQNVSLMFHASAADVSLVIDLPPSRTQQWISTSSFSPDAVCADHHVSLPRSRRSRSAWAWCWCIWRGCSLRTREAIYETAAKFWTTLFAVNFAMGVATGIVMEFQFGTNWALYSRFVGDVFGSALAAEGIFAFFLESGFLAVLVFGWDRVDAASSISLRRVMVALGSIFSSVWIIVANSWQQTPAGHKIVTMSATAQPSPRAETADFWAVVFNPSTVERLTHTLIGAFVLGSFFIMSISAWYLLKGRHEDFAQTIVFRRADFCDDRQFGGAGSQGIAMRKWSRSISLQSSLRWKDISTPDVAI